MIQGFGLELFLAQQTVRFSLIGGKAVDQTDLQALRWWEVFLLAGKLRVIAFGRVDGRCGKDRIEAVEPLAAVPVAGAALGLLIEMFADIARSEEHTSELQSLMRISYAVFCLKKKTHKP